jgi:hypothetical protein
MLFTALAWLFPCPQVIIINGLIDGTESNGLLVSVPTIANLRGWGRIGHVVYSLDSKDRSKASKYLICQVRWTS